MFFKIGVLENFTIFTGKHLCWSLVLIKLQAWLIYYVKNVAEILNPVYSFFFLCTLLLRDAFSSVNYLILAAYCWKLPTRILLFGSKSFDLADSTTISKINPCQKTIFSLINIIAANVKWMISFIWRKTNVLLWRYLGFVYSMNPQTLTFVTSS